MTKVVVEIEDVIGQFEDYDAEIRRLRAEIKQLREALHTIVQFDADYKAENEGKWHSGGVPWAVMCIVRDALGEKE